MRAGIHVRIRLGQEAVAGGHAVADVVGLDADVEVFGPQDRLLIGREPAQGGVTGGPAAFDPGGRVRVEPQHVVRPGAGAARIALSYIGDSLARTASAHKILDPNHGGLVAVRLNVLTRKTLGGLQTNLQSQVLNAAGQPIPGLYAAGEVAGFGGGGVHGYRSLEGTFLGGCLFSGRAVGRAAAATTAS